MISSKKYTNFVGLFDRFQRYSNKYRVQLCAYCHALKTNKPNQLAQFRSMISHPSPKLSPTQVFVALFLLGLVSSWLYAGDPLEVEVTESAMGNLDPSEKAGAFSLVPGITWDPTTQANTNISAQLEVGNPIFPEKSATGSPSDYLVAARKAFWGGAYVQAIQSYHYLTQLLPNDPEPFGELGDAYYFQGRKDLAVQAYYNAGLRFNTLNRPNEAWRMVSVIRPFDSYRADALIQEFTRITP